MKKRQLKLYIHRVIQYSMEKEWVEYAWEESAGPALGQYHHTGCLAKGGWVPYSTDILVHECCALLCLVWSSEQNRRWEAERERWPSHARWSRTREKHAQQLCRTRVSLCCIAISHPTRTSAWHRSPWLGEKKFVLELLHCGNPELGVGRWKGAALRREDKLDTLLPLSYSSSPCLLCTVHVSGFWQEQGRKTLQYMDQNEIILISNQLFLFIINQLNEF